MKSCFYSANILLPDLKKNKTDSTKWSVVACDQYTSENEYWERVKKEVGDSASTLNLILPEVYLDEREARIPEIHRNMEIYLQSVLKEYPNTMIYMERTQNDGKIRRGVVGAIDLECYDYRRGSTSLVRATEGTVLERIPPRVEVRRGAEIELPHVMLLINDAERSVIEPMAECCGRFEEAYDFDLMEKGGHVCGYFIDQKGIEQIKNALDGLCVGEAPLLFAVGDGNHSLASAKAAYEEIKEQIGETAAQAHPARYALVEIVNIYDSALEFEPIYRVMFGVEPEKVLSELRVYAEDLAKRGNANACPQTVRCISDGIDCELEFKNPIQQLTVGTLQEFIDGYISRHADARVDYIHGIEATESLSSKKDTIGFIFEGMGKDKLFETVIADGALPRKTFSMGHAYDKRFYLECRKIK